MGNKWYQRVALGVCALWLAACSGQPTADEVVRRMQAAMENFDQGRAVIAAEGTRDGQTERVVAESWAISGATEDESQVRVEVREASHDEAVGSLAVSDGETGWLYMPAAEKALTGDREALEAWRDEQGGGDELPADIESLRDAIDELLRISTVTVVGAEEIAGRDAWHLQLTPNENAPQAWQLAGGTAELWVDQGTDLPLQARYSGGPEEAGEMRVTVRELDLESPIDPALFAWTPPAGTEVIDVVTLLPERLTLPAARERAGFPLLTTASDTAEATLIEVTRQGERYIQRFEGSAGEWTLIQGAAHAGHGADDEKAGRPKREGQARGEEVKVRGVPGMLFEDAEAGRVVLTWTEGDVQHTLMGSLSAKAAVALAEALR